MTRLERQCPESAHWSDEQYLQMFSIKASGRLVLVAEADRQDAILGFMVAAQVAPEWELENIVVASAARRKGIGQRLMEALLTAATDTNSESVFLEVRESNAAARALYERVGFQETGRRKSYYRDPMEDAILYRRVVS